MEAGQVIKDLKSRESTDILYKVCCDVLRALMILHGSAWQSDLTFTLEGLWSLRDLTLGEVNDLRGRLDDALNLLNERGIVSSEKRVRASLSPPYSEEEMFHYTESLFTLIREFGSNGSVLKYRKEIMGYR
ncbi:MAG: hypothetical protein QXL67_04675 [Candidatus Bathyarchaeia archaeon]